MTRKILIGMLSLLLFLSLTACESKKGDTLPKSGNAGECPKNFTNVHAIAIRDF